MPTWILKLNRRSNPSAGRPRQSWPCALTCGLQAAGVRDIRRRSINRLGNLARLSASAAARTSLGCALLGDQEISDCDRLLRTARRTEVKTIFAIDHQDRNAGNLISHGQLLGLFPLSLRCKRLVRLEKGFAVHALAGQKFGHGFWGGEFLAIAVDGGEHGLMHLLIDLHGLQGKEHLAMRSEEHTSELQSRENLVCRLLLEKKTNNRRT